MQRMEKQLRSSASRLLLLLPLLLSCRAADPQPDHMGLFAVRGGEVSELLRQQPNDLAASASTLEGFFGLFSKGLSLDTIPDYFILYDQQFTPGNLHLAKVTPTWERSTFSAPEVETGLQVEPFEKPAGMYRLRPQQALEPGFYLIGGVGQASVGGNGYFAALCVRCDLEVTRSALEEIRDAEAKRLSEATTPTKTILQEKVRVAPYGADYYCTTCYWDLTVSDVDITWTRNPARGVNRARFSDLQDIYWDPRWRCLKMPPNANSVCALQTSSSDEGKLAAFAASAKAALLDWRQRYPRGLPYAPYVEAPSAHRPTLSGAAPPTQSSAIASLGSYSDGTVQLELWRDQATGQILGRLSIFSEDVSKNPKIGELTNIEGDSSGGAFSFAAKLRGEEVSFSGSFDASHVLRGSLKSSRLPEAFELELHRGEAQYEKSYATRADWSKDMVEQLKCCGPESSDSG